MDETINHITFIVAMSSLVVAFLLFIILDIVLIYRGNKKLLEEKLKMERQLFTQKVEQEENKNLQAILDALEEERERIAQDLHDRVGAGISTAKLYFEGIKEILSKGNNNLETNFIKVDELLTTSIDEVRKVSRNITSGVLADFGLVPALQDLKETMQSSGQLTFNLDIRDLNQRFDKKIEINVYRIIQELISNSIKHANCSSITLIFSHSSDILTLSYTDDGEGFKPQKITSGLGQKNILARLDSLGGDINNTSKPTIGASYLLNVPTKITPLGDTI
jgi:signal transduction histidine kinase